VKNDKSIDILNYIKKRIYYFSNEYITYKIILIIIVLVAWVEWSFSKLKIIEICLRSTMS